MEPLTIQRERPEGVPPDACGVCRTRTGEVQRTSLRLTSRWVCEAALGGPAGAPPALSLCRAEPDCEGLACEAPLRRTVSRRVGEGPGAGIAQTTSLLGQHLAPATLHDPAAQAILQQAAMRWAVTQAPWQVGVPPGTGEIAATALLVVNNLLCALRAGPLSPSVVPEDGETEEATALLRATAPSVRALSEGLTSESDSPPLHGGDLLAVHLLTRGFEAIYASAGTVMPEPPEPLPFWDWVLETIGLRDPAPPPPEDWSGYLRRMLGSDIRPAPKGPEGREQREAAAHREVRTALRRCDLLRQAETLFAGTVADSPAIAALVLRRLASTSEGDYALRWILREAATHSTAPGRAQRLAEVGLALLEKDADGRGLLLVGQMMAELLAAHPERGENGPLWEKLAAPPFPHFLATFIRRGCWLHRTRAQWSPAEGTLLHRVREAAESLLGAVTLANAHWQLFFLRTVDSLAEDPIRAFRLPGLSILHSADLVEKAQRIYVAYAPAPGNLPLPASEAAALLKKLRVGPGMSEAPATAARHRPRPPDAVDAYINALGPQLQVSPFAKNRAAAVLPALRPLLAETTLPSHPPQYLAAMAGQLNLPPELPIELPPDENDDERLF